MKRGRVTKREWESLRSLDIALNDEKHTEKLLIHLSVRFGGPALCWIRIKNALQWECVCRKWTRFGGKWTGDCGKYRNAFATRIICHLKCCVPKVVHPKLIRLKTKPIMENVRDCEFSVASKLLINAWRVAGKSERDQQSRINIAHMPFFAKRHRWRQWWRREHRIKQKHGKRERERVEANGKAN